MKTLSKIVKYESGAVKLNLEQYYNSITPWDSLHSRLNCHYEAWSYKKQEAQKIKAYRESVEKEPTVKRCLLILDLQPFRSLVKGKHSIGREFQSLAVQGKKPLT